MQKVITFDDNEMALHLFGTQDRYLKKIRDVIGVKLVARDGTITVEGEPEPVGNATDVLNRMLTVVRKGQPLSEGDVDELIAGGQAAPPKTRRVQALDGFRAGMFTSPKSKGQAKYVTAIQKNDLVFCTGPAGTGKTFLAVAVALNQLKHGWFRKIILARPAVEAGERLGFLPGDMYAKVNPYLRPLYDALSTLMDPQSVKKYIESEIIEIMPLAFMRGRTLEDAFIILDEAQNSTAAQMKTFLTRMGVGSKIVVTGDITQVDLPEGEVCGLVDVQGRLRGIPGVAFVALSEADIVRHPLVRSIVKAYSTSPDGAAAPDAGQEE